MALQNLLKEIKQCTVCKDFLPHGVNPVMTAHRDSRILVIGQAPGRIVHQTSIPWNDKSGDTLRGWMGIDRSIFYDTTRISIIPMGFCYPGTGSNGDLPPRKECAPLWHARLLEELPNIQLTLLIGQYAQKYYLKRDFQKNLTKTVEKYYEYLPQYFPLPHPSPRNALWRTKNLWFASEVVPDLKRRVYDILEIENP